MQTIFLKKFGAVLVSRPAGREAYQAVRATIDLSAPIQIDCEGVLTISPSWLDEFLINLSDEATGEISLLARANASVLASIPVLVEARRDKVADILRRVQP